jgi:hypothetical protein
VERITSIYYGFLASRAMDIFADDDAWLMLFVISSMLGHFTPFLDKSISF